MLRVLAYDHNDSFSLYDLAFIANFLYGRFNLHDINTIPFLFRAPGDASLGRVVYRHLDRDLVTGQYPNIIHSELPRQMRGYDHVVGQLYLELRVGKSFYNYSLEFNYIVFWQKYPSLTSYNTLIVQSTFVSISIPCSVIAIEFS